MSSERDRLNEALPSYEIFGELGRGAFGQVLSGRHRQLGRQVAIKQLPRAFGADPEVRRRFAAEARVLASLDHPHIVPIFDYVEKDGLCILVMELLGGGSVRRQQEEKGISPQQACAIGLATCAALDYAHERGVLHRDIKPDNLLFTTGRMLKVTDFGIAKVVGNTLATRAGEALGTPAYMAPEQCLGETPGPTTDVYATGVMLYELLAGRLPFSEEGDILSLLYRHVHEAPPSLAAVARNVPEGVAFTIMRALAKDPADRHQSAESFGVALAESATIAWGVGWLAAAGVKVMAVGPIHAATQQPGEAKPGRIETVPPRPAPMSLPTSPPPPPGEATAGPAPAPVAPPPVAAVLPTTAAASLDAGTTAPPPAAPAAAPPAAPPADGASGGPPATTVPPPFSGRRSRRRSGRALLAVGAAVVLAGAVLAVVLAGGTAGGHKRLTSSRSTTSAVSRVTTTALPTVSSRPVPTAAVPTSAGASSTPTTNIGTAPATSGVPGTVAAPTSKQLVSALVAKASVPENFSFYYEGASFRVTRAGDTDGNVVLSVVETNPTAYAENLSAGDFVLSDGQTPLTASLSSSIGDVPPGASGVGQITFQVPSGFDAATTVLTVGPPGADQVVVPFSSPAKAQLLTPVPVRVAGRSTALGPDKINLTAGELRFDDPTDQDQVPSGQALVELAYSLTCGEPAPCEVDATDFLLVSPAGTSSGTSSSSENATVDADATAANFTLFFQVPYPTAASGAYVVKVSYQDNAGKNLAASIPVTIPAAVGTSPAPSGLLGAPLAAPTSKQLVSALVAKASVPENFSFYYEGASFRVTRAGDTDGNVVLSVVETNPTVYAENLSAGDFVLSDGQTPLTASLSSSIGDVPPGASGVGQITFQVPSGFDAATTVLTVGPPGADQVVVPFSSPAKAQLLTPVPVRVAGRSTALGPDKINLTAGELRFDDPTDQDQVPSGQALVELAYSLTCGEPAPCEVDATDFLLVSPAGTSSGTSSSSENATVDADATAANFTLFFQVPYPTAASGAYVVKVSYQDNAGKNLAASIPVTIPAA